MPSLSLQSFAATLQTTDPLFPIGSYAHSYGLEELTSCGKISTPEDLFLYLESTIFLNLQEFELPYLRFAHTAILDLDFQEIQTLDCEIGASKLSKETRHASASQGQQRLRLIRKLRPTDTFERLYQLKKDKAIVPHHIIVFAAENADLQTPIEASLAAWAYQALAAPCAASLKLMRIGQEGAQLVLTKALHSLESIIERSLEVDREFAGACLPALDIASDRHERAFARLFIS